LCGNGLDPLYAECKRQGLRLVDVRNEQAAGYMADAVGRLTGRVGVCTFSSGVAHLNALTGVVNAYFDGSQMLLITGASESRTAGMGHFQDLDHVAIARPVCKLAQRVDRPERIALAVHEAFAAARGGRPGPVHLTIPGDVLTASVDEIEVPRGLTGSEEGNAVKPASLAAGAATHGTVLSTPRSLGDEDLIREAVNLLARAERPVLVAGSGVFYANAEEPLRRLVEVVGLPVVTPIRDRGVVSGPMPEYLGVIGAASGGPAILPDANLILLVGGRVDYRLGYPKPPAVKENVRVIRIDRDPGELNQGVLPDVGILGGPSTVLHQVRDEWLRRHLPNRTDWLREAQSRAQRFNSRWAKSPAPSPMTGHHLVEAIRGTLTDETIFLIDGGNNRVPLVAIVADDQAWGIVASDQKRSWGEPISSLLGPVDYARVAEGFGARGVTVTQPDELAPAIREAFASGQPTLIEVPIALRAPTD
jgi:acetolactate synthase-1/2/3 large subunit